MLTQAQRQTLIEQIEHFPAQIADLVRDCSPEQLTTASLSNEWTVAQNVHHLADSHMNSYIRCKLIATEEHPPLKPYDEHAWAQFPDATSVDLSTSLALLASLHARWGMFWRALPEGAWTRVGIHAANGSVTLEQQIEAYVAHGAAHVAQIERVLAAQKA